MTTDPHEGTDNLPARLEQHLREALADVADQARPRPDAWPANQARLRRLRVRRRIVVAAVATATAAAVAVIVVATTVVPDRSGVQTIQPATSSPSPRAHGLPTWNPVVYPELIVPVGHFQQADGAQRVEWLVFGRPNLSNNYFTPNNPNEPALFPELKADDLVSCTGEGTAQANGDVGLHCIPEIEPVAGQPYFTATGGPTADRPAVTQWIVSARPDVRSLEILVGTADAGRGTVTGVLPARQLGPGSLTSIRVFAAEAPTGEELLGYRSVLDDGRRDHHYTVDLANPPPD